MPHIQVNLNAMEQVRAGVIVLLPTGVVFNLQTAGTCCRQRQEMGLFLPLEGHDLSEEPEVEEFRDQHILYANDFRAVDAMCRRLEIPFVSDPTAPKGSSEAWVYGTITPNTGLLAGVVGERAVLVWDNSD